MTNYNWNWSFKNTVFAKNRGKVFSCFSCGGGSTMGYKLAGFDVIGCNEIDPRMMNVYIKNHNPDYPFLAPTLTANNTDLVHFEKPNYLGTDEALKMSTFPSDYDFNSLSPHYVCGMSVPPVMVARIANEIYNQWLVNL